MTLHAPCRSDKKWNGHKKPSAGVWCQLAGCSGAGGQLLREAAKLRLLFPWAVIKMVLIK